MAWRRIGARLALLSGATTALILGLWWLSSGRVRSFMNDLFAFVYRPAVAVAIWLSPNPHAISLFVYFGATVIQTFVMFAIAFGVRRAIRTVARSRRGKD